MTTKQDNYNSSQVKTEGVPTSAVPTTSAAPSTQVSSRDMNVCFV